MGNIISKIGFASLFSFFVFIVSLPLFIFIDPSAPIIYLDSTITFPLGGMLFFISLIFIRSGKKLLKREGLYEACEKSLRVLFDWAPLPILLFIYENFKARIHLFNHKDFTSYLIEFDRTLFGTDLSIYLQKVVSPILTDVMAFFYAIYFAIPFICLWIFYIKGMEREFRLSSAMLVLCFYIGFLGYVLVPMKPPWAYLDGAFTKKLQGIFLHNTFDSFYKRHNPSAEWGAFPSLHVGVSTLGLLISYRFKGMIGRGRALFYILLPFVIGLWVSTIYLRHHWFIDIVAGWIVAIIAYEMGNYLEKGWEKVLKKVGLR